MALSWMRLDVQAERNAQADIVYEPPPSLMTIPQQQQQQQQRAKDKS
jgi:hypothetical protein